jgi:hypothetical protein
MKHQIYARKLNYLIDMIKSSVLAAVFCTALGSLTVSAQPVLETVQQFVVGPQPDGWKFSFQLSRFLPSTPSDQLVKVELILSVNTSYPAFSFTANKDNTVANWDVTEIVTVKNLQFNADDGCDDDQDGRAYKELEIGTELAGSSAPLSSGSTQTVAASVGNVTQPTITLTSPDDLKRFIGDSNAPKAININMVNKQSRSFTAKPGDATFTPARKDYHPTTGATLTVNYYTSTTTPCASYHAPYAANCSYLITPTSCQYSCNTH